MLYIILSKTAHFLVFLHHMHFHPLGLHEEQKLALCAGNGQLPIFTQTMTHITKSPLAEAKKKKNIVL